MRNEKYKRQYERYDYLKKIHICVNCGNEEAEPNSILCLDCKEKKYKKHKEYYKSNREDLKKRYKDYYKKLYYTRKNQGICTKCGKRNVCKNSTTLCIDCYIKKNRIKDKRWNNEISRSERAEYNMCYICAKKGVYRSKLCEACYKKSQEKMKKLNENPTKAMLQAREEYTNRFRYSKEIMYQQQKHKTTV